jgi:hypothetical protein
MTSIDLKGSKSFNAEENFQIFKANYNLRVLTLPIQVYSGKLGK